MVSNIMYAAFGFLLAFLLFRGCEGKDCPDTPAKIEYRDVIVTTPVLTSSTETNTVDEVRGDSDLFVDPADTVTKFIIQRIIDSTAIEALALITKRYYDLNAYVDSIKIDTLGYVIIKDTLQKNQLRKRTIEYMLTMPLVQVDKQKGFLSAGVMAGGNINSFDLGLSLMYTTRDRMSIGYDYNFIDKAHYIRVMRSVFKRKK